MLTPLHLSSEELPLVATSADLRPSDLDELGTPDNPLDVLLVEDNPGDARLVLRELGLPEGPTVRTNHVRTLSDAREAVRGGSPNVVLLDLGLPDASELEALDELRAQVPDSAFVVLTGRSDVQTGAEALRRGAQEFLVKGQFDTSGLVRSLRLALTRKANDALRAQLYHQERLASVGELAASVAHEINNPAFFVKTNLETSLDELSVLEAMVEGLLGQEPDAQREFASFASEHRSGIRESLEGIHRITTIVAGLRDYARGDVLQPERTDLRECAQRAVRLVHNYARHRARVVFNSEPVPALVAFPSRLTQLLVNLIVNAVQAFSTPDVLRNLVEVSLSTDGPQGPIRLVVEDNAGGIPKELLERVFEPFFTTKARSGGTGLGLALCAATARAHAGELRLESRPDEGTTAVLLVPLDTGLRPPRPSAPPTLRPTQEPELRVLVVDDEPLIVKSLARGMRRFAVEVVGASSVEEAQALVAAEGDRLDAVLSDVVMPGTTGRALGTWLRRNHPRLGARFALMTGGALETPAGPEAVPSVPMLAKPVDLREMARVLRKLARSRSGDDSEDAS